MKRLYSSRLAWHTPENRIAATRAGLAEYLDLTVTNPTMAGFIYPEREILEALSAPAALRYEPSPLGLDLAREAVARYYGRRVSPDRVLLTASTSEAYSYLFKLFCDPGDEVLTPAPSYPLFEFLAQLEGVRATPYALGNDGHWFVDELPAGSRTRALVAVSPNNPTGSALSSAELQRMLDVGLPVILDEVFRDYGTPVESDEVFRLNGLSKVAGLPQLKLGWIVCPDRVPPALELIADTYLSVASPVQHALAALLELAPGIQLQIRERCAANEAFLRAAMAGTAATPLVIEGGWTVPIELPKTRSEEDWVCGLLLDRGVFVQPGYFYDFPREAFCVVSLLPPRDVFEEGVRRLAAYVC
jgi:alanine-synthesizing transaminase